MSMNWIRNFRSRLYDLPEDIDDGLAFWREKLLSAMLLIGIAYCPITLIPTAMLIIEHRYWSLAVIDLVALVLCIYFYLNRKASYRLRAFFVLAMLYAIGAGIILRFGLVSGGPAWLFAFSVLAGMLLGLRAACVAVALNVLTLGPMAYWFGDGAAVFSNVLHGDLARAVAASGSYLLMNVTVSASAAIMVKGLEIIATRYRVTLDAKNQTVSELENSRNALKAMQERLHMVFQQAPFGMALIGPDGRFLWINPKFIEIFGYELDEIPDGSTWFQKAYPEEPMRKDVIKDWKADLERYEIGEVRVRIYPVTCKDGTKKTIQFYPVRLHTHEDLLVCEDITERLRLEEQLQHARKMEAIGTLAGGVAHDFNNLLQGVVGYAQLLLMGKSEHHPDYARLKGIEHAVERAAHLVAQLMLFGRKAVARRKVLHLEEEIHKAVQILERTLPRMIRIELKADPDVLLIEADPTQIEQVVLNLGSNAADAMPEGGLFSIEIRNIRIPQNGGIAQQQDLAEGSYVLLKVSDTGSGMDAATLKHIFEPFFTTKGVGKGTGLGLASVYGIVAGHGGSIECDSKPGKGTTFRIYLPAVSQLPESKEEGQEQKPLRGGTEHILVVDDEAAIREMLMEVLPIYGYTVSCVANGEEAIELFRNEPKAFDCILLDLNMPGMGGYRCLKELLLIDPHAVVLIASGYAEGANVHQAVQSGARGYLSKPYRIADLLQGIRKILDSSGSYRDQT